MGLVTGFGDVGFVIVVGLVVVGVVVVCLVVVGLIVVSLVVVGFFVDGLFVGFCVDDGVEAIDGGDLVISVGLLVAVEIAEKLVTALSDTLYSKERWKEPKEKKEETKKERKEMKEEEIERGQKKETIQIGRPNK